jgi:drug/metabolite transporter (DMT)-like permease
MFILMIGAVSVLTFVGTFFLTGAIATPTMGGGRFQLGVSAAVTAAVGYGLFMLADRLGLRQPSDTPRGTLFT